MVEAIFGLIGVVVGGFLTIGKDSIAAWKRRKEEGSYSAIRLICILHEYADHCVDVVQDDGTSHGQPAGRSENGEEYYIAQVRTPAPPEYPDDISWQSLPNPLMHQILGLPNKARITDRNIAGVAEYVADYPDYSELFEARQEGYARLGSDALALADQLAEKYQVKATYRANLDFDWDAQKFLSGKLSEIDKYRKEREERSRKPLNEFTTSTPVADHPA